MLEKANEEQWDVYAAAHLLNRAGFGGTPEQIGKLHKAGPENAINWVMAGKEDEERFPAPEWAFEEGGNPIQEMRRMAAQNPDLSEKELADKRRQILRASRAVERRRLTEMTNWWFMRMLKGSYPLREKMTLFWHGHFATSFQKVRSARLMFFQNHVFRFYALGSFRELTKKISVDPAMMFYLDMQTSKRQQPNENFARELMELFMLGEGHYTEKDIKEAARAFTGYRLNRDKGEFIFSDNDHDWEEKNFFGQRGNYNGDQIIDIILEKDQCARFIARKIWEFFVYDDPSEELVESLAQLFRENDFEIKPLMRKIFESSEFYSEKAMRTQVKSPIDYVVKMCKQLKVDVLSPLVLAGVMDQLGQVLFLPPNVAGWEGGRTWVNTNTLLSRYNVAGLFLKGASGDFQLPLAGAGGGGQTQRRRMGGQTGERYRKILPRPDYKTIAPPGLRENPEELVKRLAFRLFQHPLAPAQQKSFEEYAAGKMSEGFADEEVADLLHIMMSTPHYQLT